MLKTRYACSSCGYDSPKWYGRCPECANWNTFEEQIVEVKKKSKGKLTFTSSAKPQKISKVNTKILERVPSGFEECDRVLGGGIVPGSVILLSGDPGIGKSTLMLQIAISIASKKKKILYVSGEESESQVSSRASRIADRKKLYGIDLLVLSSTDIDQILHVAEKEKVDQLIVDSIQTVSSNEMPGFPGSITQIRYATMRLSNLAKSKHIPVFLIGHVTKEGVVAGPQLLSHMVDTVLYLEGDPISGTRILRTFKNRFGDISEVGIFVMQETGLVQVTDTNEFFLGEEKKGVPGSCIAVIMEGSRPLLVEIQSLVTSSNLTFPRRVASGIDQRRLELLLAVLQKHTKVPVGKFDIFVNVVGGFKISETASDLAVIMAIFSSFKNIALKSTACIAEVGLLSELKIVPNLDKRIQEAKKLGIKRIITRKNAASVSEAIRLAQIL